MCGAAAAYVFTLPVLRRPTSYYECRGCGYLQTATPDWLEEAYASAINDVDTGIMVRNRINIGRVLMTLVALRRLRGKVVDHAGGYGLLVRMLRDAGIDAYWRDAYCSNLLARGFEADSLPCDLVTAFEVFEHLVDPVAEMRRLLDSAPAVLISTELIPGQTPSPDWWYLGPDHGQHIGFFRFATLQWMAGTLGCQVVSDGVSTHLFARSTLPRGWRTLQRVKRCWPLIAYLRLDPKVQSDFVHLSGRSSTPKPQ